MGAEPHPGPGRVWQTEVLPTQLAGSEIEGRAEASERDCSVLIFALICGGNYAAFLVATSTVRRTVRRTGPHNTCIPLWGKKRAAGQKAST